MYSQKVWDKAELVNNMDNVNPSAPEWGYGFSFWFFIVSIALSAISFVILIILGRVMNEVKTVVAEATPLLPSDTTQTIPVSEIQA